jgi:Glycosyl hydrolases family 2
VGISLLGVEAASTVTLDAGTSTDVTFDPASFSQVKVANPQLWWPNGYGEPILHNLSLRAAVGGAQSDAWTVRLGIRQLDYHSTPRTGRFRPAPTTSRRRWTSPRSRRATCGC